MCDVFSESGMLVSSLVVVFDMREMPWVNDA